MKEQLKGRSFAEEEGLSSVLSELTSEILRVFADWNRRLRLCLLVEGEYVEQSLNLLRLLTGSIKRAWRVRVLSTHPVSGGPKTKTSRGFNQCAVVHSPFAQQPTGHNLETIDDASSLGPTTRWTIQTHFQDDSMI
jgi:hypothetical protein